MTPGIVETQTKTSTSHDWADAISLWLDTCKSENTRLSYGKGLRELLVSSGKSPELITQTDIIRWKNQLEKTGLSPATVHQRIYAVASFYRFVTSDYIVINSEGRQVPLSDYNPASGKSIRVPVEMYGKATWLDPDESRALLDAINRVDLQGYRDFALFLGYLMLSRRNSEWRRAKWGDFEQSGSQVIFRWGGKGKVDQRLDVPAPVWAAVCMFIEKSGRGETIQPEDYIFTALTRTGKTLPNGSRVAVNKPICSHEVGRLLQRYLKLAGLNGRGIKPHSLRHSGALLMEAAGASNQEIMEYLGHSSISITQVYLHKLHGNHNSHWMTVSEMLGLSPAPSSKSKGKTTD